MTTPSYPTNLSDAEWALVEPHLPAPSPTGRPRKHLLRTLVDAILSRVRSGCAWRLLPREVPPWKTVFPSFRQWRLDGTWMAPGWHLDALASSVARGTSGSLRPRRPATRRHH